MTDAIYGIEMQVMDRDDLDNLKITLERKLNSIVNLIA